MIKGVVCGSEGFWVTFRTEILILLSIVCGICADSYCNWQIILYVKEEMKKNNISEQTVVAIIWSSVMSTVEWNKKEELVAEQAIKHLKVL